MVDTATVVGIVVFWPVGLGFVAFGSVFAYVALRGLGRWYGTQFLDPSAPASVEAGDGLVRVEGEAAPPDGVATPGAEGSTAGPFSGEPTLFGEWELELVGGDLGEDVDGASGRFGGDFEVVGDGGRVGVAADADGSRPTLDLGDRREWTETVGATDPAPESIRRGIERSGLDLPETALTAGPGDGTGPRRLFVERRVDPGDEVAVVGRAVDRRSDGGPGPGPAVELRRVRPYDDHLVTDDAGSDDGGVVVLSLVLGTGIGFALLGGFLIAIPLPIDPFGFLGVGFVVLFGTIALVAGVRTVTAVRETLGGLGDLLSGA